MGYNVYDELLEQIDSFILNTLAHSSLTPYEITTSLDTFLERYHISLLSVTNRLNELQLDCMIACICPEADPNRSFFALRVPVDDLPMFGLSDEMIDTLADKLNLSPVQSSTDKIYLTDGEDGKPILHIFEDTLEIFETDVDDQEIIADLNNAEANAADDDAEDDEEQIEPAEDEAIETADVATEEMQADEPTAAEEVADETLREAEELPAEVEAVPDDEAEEYAEEGDYHEKESDAEDNREYLPAASAEELPIEEQAEAADEADEPEAEPSTLPQDEPEYVETEQIADEPKDVEPEQEDAEQPALPQDEHEEIAADEAPQEAEELPADVEAEPDAKSEESDEEGEPQADEFAAADDEKNEPQAEDEAPQEEAWNAKYSEYVDESQDVVDAAAVETQEEAGIEDDNPAEAIENGEAEEPETVAADVTDEAQQEEDETTETTEPIDKVYEEEISAQEEAAENIECAPAEEQQNEPEIEEEIDALAQEAEPQTETADSEETQPAEESNAADETVEEAPIAEPIVEEIAEPVATQYVEPERPTRRTAFSRADIQQEIDENPEMERKRLESMRLLGLIPNDVEEAQEAEAQAEEDAPQEEVPAEPVAEVAPEPEPARYSAVMTPRNELEYYLQEAEKEKRTSYKSMLHKLFSVTYEPKETEDVNTKITTKECASMTDFREEMRKQGYDVRQYVVQHTVQYYSQKYINVNSIKFATSCIVYLLALALVLIGYFACDRYAGLGYKPYLAVGIGLLVIPMFYGLRYVAFRDKHAPANFSLKLSLATAFMAAIILMMVFLLIAFFNTNSGANISEINTLVAPVFYPAVMLLLLPASVLVYALLYRTRKFYVL